MKQIEEQKDLIGKTITDTKIVDGETLVIFFEDKYAYFASWLGHPDVSETEITFIKPKSYRYNYLEPWTRLRLGLISESEYRTLMEEKEKYRTSIELKQYERLKEKYG